MAYLVATCTASRSVGPTEIVRLYEPASRHLSLNAMAISPWSDSVQLTSPDGSLTATVRQAEEIAMGAPTSGIFCLSNGFTLDSCKPSLVWSDDSKYVAIPQWTNERKQRLIVVEAHRKIPHTFAALFRVLELHSFQNGWIEGVDSPIYIPARVMLNVKDLFG